MLVSGIKSKPIYSPLRADARGRYHLMLSVGGGATALLRVIDEMAATMPESLARTRVFLVEHSPAAFEQRGLAGIVEFDNTQALLAEMRHVLDQSLMGTRLYVAGPESFIGLTLQLALAYDMNKDEIRAEEVGTRARRVSCVHCRTIAEDVRTNIVRCAGCDRWLFVRDHYSRRLAAYMGVMVDAEKPGERPVIEEIFP